MRNILFCIPYYTEYDSVTKSLERLKQYFTQPDILIINDCKITIETMQSCYVGMIRNAFITGDLKINLYKPAIRPFDEFIFCDSDIEFMEKDFLRVLSYDLNIISLPYEMKSDEPCYCARDERGNTYPLDTKDLRRVYGCGSGGLLKIKRKVFETVPPYWWFIEKTVKENILDFETEDFSFCRKAREAGFDVWIDFNYPLIHNNPYLIEKKGKKMEQKQGITIRQALNHCIKTMFSIVEAVEAQENQTQVLVDKLKEYEAMTDKLKELDPIMAAEKPEVNAQ